MEQHMESRYLSTMSTSSEAERHSCRVVRYIPSMLGLETHYPEGNGIIVTWDDFIINRHH